MFKKFVALPFKHKFIICRTWYLFVYWHILITFVPYRFWKNKITSPALSSKNQDQGEDEKQIIHIIRLTESVARHHFVRVNCLRRCMVQKTLLNGENITSELIIGVKKQQQTFAAHCWLTHKNQIINDSVDNISEYVALQKLTSDSNINILKNI